MKADFNNDMGRLFEFNPLDMMVEEDEEEVSAIMVKTVRFRLY
jgi:hypothetical protein